MSAERELERASQEFWLATGSVRERCETLTRNESEPAEHGYAHLVALAEKRHRWDPEIFDSINIYISSKGVLIKDGDAWMNIACHGEQWVVTSERKVWSKDSRDWGTTYDDASFAAFGRAYRAAYNQMFNGDDL